MITTKANQPVTLLKRTGINEVLIRYDDGKESRYPISHLKPKEEVKKAMHRIDEGYDLDQP